MKKYLYQTYGISISSTFKIDAFQEVENFEEDTSIFHLKESAIDFNDNDFIDDFVIRQYVEEGFLYVIKNTVAFLVKENCMLIEPLCDNSKVWQSFLVGGAMSIVLIQKGYFLLHGSAVEHNNAAYLFLGLSGVGKSTLVTGLEQNGYDIITDDICAISKQQADLMISAGTKQVRLLEDAVEKLKISDVVSLEHPTAQPKYGYNFFRKAEEFKTKIEKVIELVVDESQEEEIIVEQIVSFGKIELLSNNIYKENLAKTVRVDTQNFELMMLSANKIECLRIRRKYKEYDLSRLITLVKEHLN